MTQFTFYNYATGEIIISSSYEGGRLHCRLAEAYNREYKLGNDGFRFLGKGGFTAYVRPIRCGRARVNYLRGYYAEKRGSLAAQEA